MINDHQFAPGQLSLNKGNYTVKSFVKNVYPCQKNKKNILFAAGNYHSIIITNKLRIKKFYKEYSALQAAKSKKKIWFAPGNYHTMKVTTQVSYRGASLLKSVSKYKYVKYYIKYHITNLE